MRTQAYLKLEFFIIANYKKISVWIIFYKFNPSALKCENIIARWLGALGGATNITYLLLFYKLIWYSLFFRRNSLGVILYFFLKSLLKYDKLSNPVSNEISIIELLVEVKRSAAFSNL